MSKNEVNEKPAVTLFKEKYKEVKTLLGKDKADRFLSAFIQLANDYNLKDVNPKSLVNVAMSVARLKLELDPAFKEVYVVPFKNKKNGNVTAQLIISAKGYKTLCARDGITIKSFVAYKCDTFNYTFNGWDETIVFSPNFADRENEDGDWVWSNLDTAFAVAKLPNGELINKFLGAKEIEKRRNVSQNPDGIWITWAEEMINKTIIKALVKSLPRIEDDSLIAQALNVDDKPIDVEIVENNKEEKKIPIKPKSQDELNDIFRYNSNTKQSNRVKDTEELKIKVGA